ncbi:diguanylate cyclase [Saccharobesus litoralis]|uniref:Diguanylate cyclase n=1 Tax=Saccharobesus litoralis TaxID=2172099 RepID=A0A2S0VQB3_9ALTE|nr:sensor domain-containing diguanylate cyclase [Saccharobesus litoralis]AWB66405.1 diguanylate cyclase [Saccharobesus litoralis]
MNKTGLLVRLAVVIIFASLAVGFISAQIFYRFTYLSEVEVAEKEIAQLYETVSATASIAAYLGDSELAKEVVNGLATNDIVDFAMISAGDIQVSSAFTEEDRINQSRFDIYSPFIKDQVVGQLTIIHDINYISRNAKDLGAINATALVAQSIVVTLVAIIIAYLLITQPMISIAKALHKITPGGSKRIPVPSFHNSSELGKLVRDVNNLLDKAERQISQERTLRQEIELLEKRFRMLFENSVSPIVLMEPRGSILLYNGAFSVLLTKLGLHFKKNFGPMLEELFDEPELLHKAVQMSFANDEIATGEYKLTANKLDDNVWVQVVVTSITSDNMKEYYQITLHDISKRKKELELLNQRAHFDQLTQLLNRHATEKSLFDMMVRRQDFAFILMDLNGFKQINDIYGHESGDEILVFVANQLKKVLRQDDIACRWGGDEFVVVLPHADDMSVKMVAEKIHTRITKQHYLINHDKHVSVGASMGVSFYPKDSHQLPQVIKLADVAMYEVKKFKDTDPSRYLQFSYEMNVKQG